MVIQWIMLVSMCGYLASRLCNILVTSQIEGYTEARQVEERRVIVALSGAELFFMGLTLLCLYIAVFTS
jgi:hypothetical protein